MQQLLFCLEAQTFQAFELILVDDFSTDNSKDIASDVLKNSTLNSQIMQLSKHLPEENEFLPNKKKGIALAIEYAKAEIILLTDADCVFDPHWIDSTLRFYNQNNIEMGSGPVVFHHCHTMLEKFQQIDLIAMMALTKWTIKYRIPVLSNGANMIFSKKAFFEVNGYEGNEIISSGDDVFLLQKFMQDGRKINFIEQVESIAYTKPAETFTLFFHQRIRWAGKSLSYKNRGIQVCLFSIYACNLGIITCLLLGILGFIPCWIFAVCFMLKLSIDFIIIYPQAMFFKKRKVLLGMPLWEIMHIVYVVTIGFLSLKKSYIWKERSIKR